MVQIGWNAGPKHARVWGLAKSYTKKLDEDTKVDHDKDAVALISLVWNIAKAALPEEVTGHIERSLEDHGLPRIATPGVAEGLPPYFSSRSSIPLKVSLGKGFCFTLGEKTYTFPYAERAPPEGYLTQDYVA